MLGPLRAPTRDGEVLLAPDGGELAGCLDAARQRVARMDFHVAGWPARRLREEARAELARLAGAELPGMWMMTGHQPVMYHAGVWFKDAAIAALAEATGGAAVHLVADLDEIRHLALAIPVAGSDGNGPTITLTEAPYALRAGRQCPCQAPPPSREMFESLAERVCRALAAIGIIDATPFPTWVEAARSGLPAASTLGEWLAAARNGVDCALGLAVHDAPLSRLLGGPAFARFAADILLRHDELHRMHAVLLAEHRRARGITNRAQPVPDLSHRDDLLEVPLWVVHASGPREPLLVGERDRLLTLATPEGELGRFPDEPEGLTQAIRSLAANGVLIAPRALTLTMFARSFLADVFVHGIGGAAYDELGDALTERWYGWRPPPFVVASATLRLPLPRFPVTHEDLARALWDVHHAWHNPAMYDGRAAMDGAPQVEQLAAAKRAALERIDHAPRRHPERAAAFGEVQRINEELRALLPDALEQTEQAARRTREQLAHNALADSREYFFAFMPRSKLTALIEQARAWAGGLRSFAAPVVTGVAQGEARR